jgi:hypothetical protein
MNSNPVIEVDDLGASWIAVRTRFDGISPADLLAWFTQAPKLNAWWGDEALIEPRPGGLYEVLWPGMNWTMRGVVALCEDDLLAYSWTWDHEPDQPARTVMIRAEPDGDDSILTITHGPYRPGAPSLPGEDADRESHREGWLFFLPRLHATIAESRRQ